MMAYDQQPEPEYTESSKEMRFATAVFTAVAAADLVGSLAGMSSIAAWDWIILWRALATGLVAGAVAYAFALIVVTIAPGLPALLLKEAEDKTGLDLGQPKRDLPTGPPKREGARPYIQTLPLAEERAFEEPDAGIEAAPEWQRRVDNMDYGNGRMLINSYVIELPEEFEVNWLYTVAEKRATGELETISLRALDEIGISRWGNGSSPANLTISVLEQAGCLKGRGANQPYDWTDGGKRTFPSPTD